MTDRVLHERAVAINEDGEIPLTIGPTEHMALRLAEMRDQKSLLQAFVADVMVQGHDYGTIPGTAKPSLLKPGAEKLCELYGFSIRVAAIDEEKDRESGYYRARVTVGLERRSDGVVVAEGVGEASTYEGRYRWRWEPEWKVPEAARPGLPYEERRDRNGNMYRSYRVPNADPHALWNTVLKMAKKRALVDATLSATRSSELFTQDVEDLAPHGPGWSEGDREREPSPGRRGGGPAAKRGGPDPITAFWAAVRASGASQREAQEILDGRALSAMTDDDRAAVLEELQARHAARGLAVAEVGE